MKCLLILSLLMVQGVWSAAAAGADDYEGDEAPVQVTQPAQRPVQTLKQFALQSIIRVFIEGDQQTKLQIINDLLSTGINPEQMLQDLYVAWLNENPKQHIIVRQTAIEACQQMGMENVPQEWAQLVVDVSLHVDNGSINKPKEPLVFDREVGNCTIQ